MDANGSWAVEELLPRLPVRNTGRGERPGDPWNLLFTADEDVLSAALEEAGWSRIPNSITASCLYGAAELLTGKRLVRFPPMNTYRLCGKPQTHNWAQAVRPVTRRHHFRLWRLPFRDLSGRAYWWGSANYDKAARFRNFSHVPDPDTGMERDHIAATLDGSPRLESARLVEVPGIPDEGVNDKGYRFFTDRRVLTASFRRCSA